jgi:glycosyltransferase involved in cell wall biosynthesis
MAWLFFSKRGNPALEELLRALRSEGVKVRAVHAGWLGSPHSEPIRTLPYRTRWLDWLHGPGLERGQPQVVLFSYPDQAPLARRFPQAQKIYYVLDDYRAYNYPPDKLRYWEDELLPQIDLLAVVSRALADVYRERYAIGRALVIPAAVPARYIPASCPAPRVEGRKVGVLGRISSRLRLDWLRQAVERLPWMELELVGDVESGELLAEDVYHLRFLQRHPRCRLVGWKPFPRLFDYAAGLDLSLMPYSARSVNPCGTPTRLFLHLPFGAPILATPGVKQVEEFQPLVETCRSCDDLVARIDALQRAGFEDGLRERRWEAARANTWEHRARAILEALAQG